MRSAGLMGWLARLIGAPASPHDAAPQHAPATPALASNTVLIDVRSRGEFDSGHIQGAISLPLDRIHVDIAGVVPDPRTPLLLYCRSGARSGRACAIVSKLGYEVARNGGGIGSVALSLNRPIARPPG